MAPLAEPPSSRGSPAQQLLERDTPAGSWLQPSSPRHRAQQRWRRVRPALSALLAGATPALAFPEINQWWLAYVSLVPLLWLLRSARGARQAALLGWCGGAGYLMALHQWLLPNLHVFFPVVTGALGLLFAPWGVLTHLLTRPGHRFAAHPAWRAAAGLVLIPSGWVIAEFFRSWQGLGGPWGLLGSSQWQVQSMLALASVGGVWLLSGLLVLVNTAVTMLLCAVLPGRFHLVLWAASWWNASRRGTHVPRGRPRRPTVAGDAAHGRRVAVPACAALLVTALGATAAALFAPGPQRHGTVRVGAVQPGVIKETGRRFARSEALTRRLAHRGLDLVVWGESSVGSDLATHPNLVRRLTRLSRSTGAHLLVNVDARDQTGRMLKKTEVIGPHGRTGQHYAKTRLVPFGEYVPFRSMLGWVDHFSRAARVDRQRGTGPRVMRVGGARLGTLICFESAFPDLSRSLATKGAELVIYQSSTTTFQDSWAPEQHAALAAVRAAETGRATVHATLSGVTTAYDGHGRRIGHRLSTDTRGAEVFSMPRVSGAPTLYDRFGEWVPALAGGALTGAAALVLLQAARRVRAGASWRTRPQKTH